MENAISAEDHGATVITYANVERLILEGEDVKGVEFTDTIGGEKYTVRAPVTVNVAGPWVDEVLAELQPSRGDENAGRFMGGTKGSHLIVEPVPRSAQRRGAIRRGAKGRSPVLHRAVERTVPDRHDRPPLRRRPRPTWKQARMRSNTSSTRRTTSSPKQTSAARTCCLPTPA